MPLTTEQRDKLVDFYLAVKSVIETKWVYCNRFNVRDGADGLTFWRIVKKFRTERNVHYANKGRFSRPKSDRNQANIDVVCPSVRQSLKKSTRTQKIAKLLTLERWS